MQVTKRSSSGIKNLFILYSVLLSLNIGNQLILLIISYLCNVNKQHSLYQCKLHHHYNMDALCIKKKSNILSNTYTIYV